MQPISFARHQFPPDIIQRAVRLYLRFTLSFHDVEELLAERGITVTCEPVRRWGLKFGPLFARNLHRLWPVITRQRFRRFSPVWRRCATVRGSTGSATIRSPVRAASNSGSSSDRPNRAKRDR